MVSLMSFRSSVALRSLGQVTNMVALLATLTFTKRSTIKVNLHKEHIKNKERYSQNRLDLEQSDDT